MTEPTALPTPAPRFTDFGVDHDIAEALGAAGIVHPFPIQALTLPLALAGNDIIGQAKTGTGKTLGFGIPMLQRIMTGAAATPKYPDGLVIVPTRELALQVADDLAHAGSKRGVKVLAVYGGRAAEPQAAELAQGVHLVVGTPGRLLDLIRQKSLNLSAVHTLVLDEADHMLDMGFLPDVEQLINMTAKPRQTMLFSATMPGEIVTMGRAHLTKPTHIRATDPDNDRATVEGVTQHVLRVHNLDKVEVLARILQAEDRGLCIVFVPTKRSAKSVTDELNDRGFSVGAVHGDLDQASRERALRAFRTGKVDVLVATDVAARGLDVDDVTHVINYACPKDPETYLHRIGRTARAGAEGVAVTFVDWDAMHLWAAIDKEHVLGLAEPVETYSTSPHLLTMFGIAGSVTGRLPRMARTRAGLESEELEDIGARQVGGSRDKRGGGGRSGRSGGRGRKREGSDRSDGEAKPRTRSKRPRVRTRSGKPVGDAPATATGEALHPDRPQETTSRRRSRSRRRTRGGKAGGGTAESA